MKRSRWMLPLLIGTMGLLAGVAGVSAAQDAASPARQGFTYDPKGQRDPFVPLVQDGHLVGSSKSLGPTGPGDLGLYGILWDPGGNSIALINNVEAKVGDRVGDYRVEEIRKDAVVVSNGDQRLELQIKF